MAFWLTLLAIFSPFLIFSFLLDDKFYAFLEERKNKPPAWLDND